MKAKGQFRTNVPEAFMRIFTALTTLTQGASLEGDYCYICGYWSEFLCPTCSLWSHSECCQALAASALSKTGQLVLPSADAGGSRSTECEIAGGETELTEAVVKNYTQLSSDAHGKFVASLVRFERAHQPGEMPHLHLSGSSCLLCRVALDYNGYSSLKTYPP